VRVARRVTISEVARCAGVAPGTVSRALNGYADVSPTTRARIVALARELGYQPDAPARSLRTRRTRLVAAYLGRCGDDATHPFFRPVLAGLSARLRAAGHGLMVVEGTGDRHDLGAGGFDGAVLMSVDADNPLVAALADAGIPCVGVDVPLPAHVAADNRGGTALAVRHLAGLGHRRIAAIAGIPHTLAGGERLEGYRAGLAAAGLPYDPALVAVGDFSAASGEAAVAALLPARPTAIVAASDLMAIGATRALTAAGIAVPEAISIVGFDDLPLASLVRPELTTVRQDPERIGAAAADAVLERIEGEPEHRTTVPVELMVRASSQSPP
jgi:LacI family transcriptional regulator